MTKQQRDWWATARIGKELDHRRKLTDEDKEDIRRLYNIERYTIRQIAREYEKVCSRRLIQYVIFPERLEVVKNRQIKNKNWIRYYDREKRKGYMRKHRQNIRNKFNLK